MIWLNLETRVLHAPEYIGSDPTARATWLNVLLWSAQQENGGRIVGGATWKDRQFQQTCGVTVREVHAAPPLLVIDGSDVLVWNYPIHKELEVKAKREGGRIGGVKSGEARAKLSLPEASSTASSSASPDRRSSASTERKGKEGKGKEEERGALQLEGVLEAQLRSDPKPEPAFPAELDTPDFRATWADWLAYRSERKLAAYKPKTIAAQLAKLAEWGHAGAIESMRASIRQQWQGLFEPKGGKQGGAILEDRLNKF